MADPVWTMESLLIHMQRQVDDLKREYETGHADLTDRITHLQSTVDRALGESAGAAAQASTIRARNTVLAAIMVGGLAFLSVAVAALGLYVSTKK